MNKRFFSAVANIADTPTLQELIDMKSSYDNGQNMPKLEKEIRIGKNTKICEKCLKVHSGDCLKNKELVMIGTFFKSEKSFRIKSIQNCRNVPKNVDQNDDPAAQQTRSFPDLR